MDYSPPYVFILTSLPKNMLHCYIYVYLIFKKDKIFDMKNRNYYIKLNIRQSRKFHWNSSFIHGWERLPQVKDIHIISHSENLKERGRGAQYIKYVTQIDTWKTNKWFNIHKNYILFIKKITCCYITKND